MAACNNARQIIRLLQNFTADHDGKYPGGTTSNEAFRELFKAGLVEDEKIFTTASSPYCGDNRIGDAPNFDEALNAGENHWAMTAGLTPASHRDAPLVFENPVDMDGPFSWNMDKAGQKAEGRAWKSGRIVIGRNDGSVAAEALAAMKGAAVPLKPDRTGKDLFERAGIRDFIDVER